MNTITITQPCARDNRGIESPSDAAWETIDTALSELEETWRHAPQSNRTHTAPALIVPPGHHLPMVGGRSRGCDTPLRATAGCGIGMESGSLLENRSGVLLAAEGRKMSDESTHQGWQRSELPSGLIDEACSRFETAWQTGQPPRIEEFLPVESPDKLGPALRISCCTWSALTSNGVGRWPPRLPKRCWPLGKRLVPMRR